MYFVPSRHEARAALALAPEQEKRQIGANDPLESLFSDIFGGGGGGNVGPTTSTQRTTPAGPRTTTVAIVVTPTPTPTVETFPPILTSAPRTTTTSTTRPVSTAQVVTVPIVETSTSAVTLTSTASNSTNTGTTDASQANSSTNSGLPSGVIGLIVAASVIFGLIFLALIARKIFQARRRSRRATWARTSIIAPFDPSGIKEKELPPPPPQQNNVEYPAYPAYPPPAMTYAQPVPYSPAAPSSAGIPAPYPFGGTSNTNPSANPLNASSYTPADLAGAPPVLIQQPATATPLTAAIPPSTLLATASGATAAATAGISIGKRTFIPSLPDELSIANGDRVRVLSSYDDGWALCEKVSTGDRGVVPQECLEDINSLSANTNTPAAQGAGDNEKLKRASSLKRDQGTY